MPAKRKPPHTVEIVLRVRVPGHWSAAHTRRQVADAWYGRIDAYGPLPAGERGPAWWGRERTIRPRWGKARLVKSNG